MDLRQDARELSNALSQARSYELQMRIMTEPEPTQEEDFRNNILEAFFNHVVCAKVYQDSFIKGFFLLFIPDLFSSPSIIELSRLLQLYMTQERITCRFTKVEDSWTEQDYQLKFEILFQSSSIGSHGDISFKLRIFNENGLGGKDISIKL